MLSFDSCGDRPLVMIVDDDEFMLEFISDTLSEEYQVISLDNGLQLLAQAQTHRPQLILADVQMPDIDGYTLCQRIKQDPTLAEIPVLFLSALDSLEDRLRGFEVGAEDFVNKPINPKMLLSKVAKVLELAEERQQLKSQAQWATNTAMLAMTSMSETGMLLEILKQLNECTSIQTLATNTLDSIRLFELEGVVQLLYGDNQRLTLNHRGPATALEISVLQHIISMDRIIQFKNRLSINYPHVQLIVNNLPIEDEERCGRLRDHLATLVQAVEVRLQALYDQQLAQQRGNLIHQTLGSLGQMLHDIDRQQRDHQVNTMALLDTLLHRVEGALVGLQLTERQETALVNLVRDSFEELSEAYQANYALQNRLGEVIHQLEMVKSS